VRITIYQQLLLCTWVDRVCWWLCGCHNRGANKQLQEMPPKMSVLESLPPEMKILIVKCLPAHDVLLVVALLSKYWLKLVTNSGSSGCESLWKHLCLQADMADKPPNLTWLSHFQQQSQFVWDSRHTASTALLSKDNKSVSKATNAQNGNSISYTKVGFSKGKHSWNVHIDCADGNYWMCLGVCTSKIKVEGPEYELFRQSGIYGWSGAEQEYCDGAPEKTGGFRWNAQDKLQFTLDCDKLTLSMKRPTDKKKTTMNINQEPMYYPYALVYIQGNRITLLTMKKKKKKNFF